MEGKDNKKMGKMLAIGAGVISLILVVLLVIGITIGRRGGTVTQDVKDGSPGVSSFRSTGETGYVEEKDQAVTEKSISPEGETSSSGTADSGNLIAELNKNIKTATMGVEVKKGAFDENYTKLLMLAEKYGGYVSDSKTTSADGRITGGNVTMRIPSESFSKAIEDCKELGEVTSLSEQTEDVTDQYVDIESRLRNLRAQEAVYLNLMAKAQTIEESIAVQTQLSTLQGEIEQLTGQKNYLDNKTQFSTISVYMNEQGTEIDTDGGWGFVQALRDAVHGIVDGLNVVIRFLGYAFIYILLACLIGFGVRVYIKRRRKAAPEKGDNHA